MITTQIKLNDPQGEIELYYEGEKAGHIEFINHKDYIDIVHTIVDLEYGGKGLGKVLVMAAVEYAKKQAQKIKTTCSFAEKVFSKTPEIQDLWFK
ncbi:MAG: N-acetyltransferase [Bacteroidetes bacterium]|nr:N-acetyltransferase [Bacteroidota bacterium]